MKLSLLFSTLIAAISLLSCRKEPASTAPKPIDVNPRIAVKLNNDYLTAAKIDSALVFWDLNGQVQQERMQLSNDTLFTETRKLSKGTGKLTIQIFSKIKLRQQSLQWERRMDLAVKEGESVDWQAPTNFDDPAWFPRVILIDAPTLFTAIVALRPADPYFLLKNVPAGFKIELERNYVSIPGGAQIVGSGLWKCNTVCTDARGIIENRDFFKLLPAQIGNQPWKMVEVGIGLFGPNYTSGPGFYFNHY